MIDRASPLIDTAAPTTGAQRALLVNVAEGEYVFP
jgi:hypothetical protein